MTDQWFSFWEKKKKVNTKYFMQLQHTYSCVFMMVTVFGWLTFFRFWSDWRMFFIQWTMKLHEALTTGNTRMTQWLIFSFSLSVPPMSCICWQLFLALIHFRCKCPQCCNDFTKKSCGLGTFNLLDLYRLSERLSLWSHYYAGWLWSNFNRFSSKAKWEQAVWLKNIP